MKRKSRSLSVSVVLGCAGLAGSAFGIDASRTDAALDLVREAPSVRLYVTGERVTTAYGTVMGTGAGARDSSARFVGLHADVFGASATDLSPGSLAWGTDLIPLVEDKATGAAKFFLCSFLQARDGVPVFRGDLRVLVRNEPGHPVVWARSAVKDLGTFRVDRRAASEPNLAGAFEEAGRSIPGIDNIESDHLVIWAGTADTVAAPVLGIEFVVTRGTSADANYARHLFVADAVTGRLLYGESQITHVDVTGTVRGVATENGGADICDNESPVILPYARVAIGANAVFADAAGAFTIPNGGSDPVTVTTDLRGEFFLVRNSAAGGTTPSPLSQLVTPPGPVDFLHNAANTDATHRGGVNVYQHANVVRDYLLAYAPSYPTISTQTGFPANINVGGTCNAFYDGGSINFFAAGGGCPATSYSTIVHHEYGHHIVNRGGSGQGQYGEGMSDVMAVLVMDDPRLAIGFFNDCNGALRNANNSVQYPCNGPIHDCGMLLSGCVWSTRNTLLAQYPSEYRDILSIMATNAVPMHTGDLITPQITIDYLTIDDTDGEVENGTPHYQPINAGFSAHNMPGPLVLPLAFSYPNGRPARINPAGGTQLAVDITPNFGYIPVPGSGRLRIDTDGDGSYESVVMTEVTTDHYVAVFPQTTCGDTVQYFVQADSSGGIATGPATAPLSTFSALSAGDDAAEFADDFETDQGWTVSGDAIDGQWQRGVPINAGRGDPTVDADGSGQCFVTDNAGGNSDVDTGVTILTGPVMDASGVADAELSYWRWFSNNQGSASFSDRFYVDVSNNNGSTWTNVETVGPAGPEVIGGWFFRQHRLAARLPLTNQMRVRFRAEDINAGSIVEAAVDGVSLTLITCTSCPADFDGDGFVTGQDFDAYVAAFESGDPSSDFDGDGFVTGLDFDAFVAEFEAGC